MVSGFSCFRIPFFRFARGAAGGCVISVNVDRSNIAQRYFFGQVERQANGCLSMDLGRITFNDGLRNAEGVVVFSDSS